MTRSSRVDGWARADPGGLAALADNWLLMAVRGLLAILFGLVMIFWRRPVLDALILSFASYAVLDGIVAISSALRAAARPMLGWPVVLEGVVSILLGGLALVWPFMPHGLIRVIAAWGLLTGILEIAMAVRVPRQHSVHWLLGTGGMTSLFLAVVVLVLPYAGPDALAWALGGYALLFGVVVSVAAYGFRRALRERRPRASR